MNKSQLILRVAQEASLSPEDAKSAVETLLNSIQGALKNGETVSLVSFGTFRTVERPPREARNPITGAVVDVPAKTVIKFKPGAGLARNVK